MPEPLNQDDQVRRIDASLRGAYPNLSTRLFEVSPFRFAIAFDAAQEDAGALKALFDERIRYASVHVYLTNQLPESSLRELNTLSDAAASSVYKGLPFRQIDLLNLLLSKFPNSGLVALSSDPKEQTITLSASRAVSDAELRKLDAATVEFGYPWPLQVKLVDQEDTPKPWSIDTNPMFIWAAALRPHAPTYVRADEAFWFDNLDRIARGQLEPGKFPGMHPDVFRCYLDLTLGGKHINLRQALMLYDEVWCSLPLAHDLTSFLDAQGLTRDDLLLLIEAGRLRVVTTQPEERLDVTFLEAAHERNADAVLGRRTTAALLMADVARTAQTSHLKDPAIRNRAGNIAASLADTTGGTKASHLHALLWPFQAQLGGLQSVLNIGSKAGPASSLGHAIADHIQATAEIDVALELSLYSEHVHIAHALNATHFPGLEAPDREVSLMSGLARAMNFHRSFNKALTAAWVGNERRRSNGVSILPPLPLFDFPTWIPIKDLLADTSLGSTRAEGRALMARLVELHPDARAAEIKRLELALKGIARRRDDQVIDLDAVETGVSVATTIMDVTVLPVIGPAKLLRKAAERLRHSSPTVDRFIADLERDTVPATRYNHDLDFLSRIQRVASFRQPRV